MKERLPVWVQGWLDTVMPLGQVLLVIVVAWLLQRLVRAGVRRLVHQRGLPPEMATVLRRLSASLIAAACPQRIERLLAIEALGALAETPERTVARMREALIAHRNLKDKKLRVFPDIDSAVRTRQYASLVPGSGLDEASVRLLVERGLREVEGGYEWSSDPRLTLPTMTRMTEPQIENLVAGIECPVRAIFADPAQPYLPDALRRHRVALLPQGELIVIAGGHHLHMQQVDEAAAAIGGFFGS